MLTTVRSTYVELAQGVQWDEHNYAVGDVFVPLAHLMKRPQEDVDGWCLALFPRDCHVGLIWMRMEGDKLAFRWLGEDEADDAAV